MGEKSKGFIGKTIKDTWTITRGGWKQEREVRKAGVGVQDKTVPVQQ